MIFRNVAAFAGGVTVHGVRFPAELAEYLGDIAACLYLCGLITEAHVYDRECKMYARDFRELALLYPDWDDVETGAVALEHLWFMARDKRSSLVHQYFQERTIFGVNPAPNCSRDFYYLCFDEIIRWQIRVDMNVYAAWEDRLWCSLRAGMEGEAIIP